jgi:hypothetical protein
MQVAPDLLDFCAELDDAIDEVHDGQDGDVREGRHRTESRESAH